MTERTVVDDLRRSAALRARVPAVVDAQRGVTYAELHAESAGLARGLVDLGVRRGDRVATVLRSGVDAAVAIYGAALAGAAFVPLDHTAPQERLVQVLGQCGAVAVVCEAEAAGRVLAAAQRLPEPPVVVAAGGHLGAVSLQALTGLPALTTRTVLDVDLAAIIHTSGSTGVPKGATFLHRNVHFLTTSVLDYLELRGSDRVLSVLPLSHTYGLYQLLMAVRVGCTLHLHPSGLPAGRLVQALEEHEITVLPGIPTLWQLLASAGTEGLDGVRVLTNAGAALPPARLEQVRRAFPRARLFAMYGQTECGRVCFLPPERLAARPHAVGSAIAGTDAWVEAPGGGEAAVDQVGELMVRGDHVMQGYWGDPAATAAKLVQGRWPGDRVLRTGDLFRRDARGDLCFVARQDDIITTRGEKVAPLEVERVLCGADGVAEAAVVGVPHDLLGECVVAHVAPLEGRELSPDALRRHCALHLEPVRVPRYVVIHAELPRLSNGKTNRLALTELGLPVQGDGRTRQPAVLSSSATSERNVRSDA